MARKAESSSTRKAGKATKVSASVEPRGKAAAKKTAAKKTARKAAVKKLPAKKATAKKAAPRRRPAPVLTSAAEDALAIEAQNRRYYDVFQTLDVGAMASLWWHDSAASCIHPGWDSRQGWSAIRDSYDEIFQNTRAIHFALGDVRARVLGDLGYVTCVENLVSQEGEGGGDYLGAVLSTNIFERRGAEWRLIHHHASPFGGDVVEFPEGPLH